MRQLLLFYSFSLLLLFLASCSSSDSQNSSGRKIASVEKIKELRIVTYNIRNFDHDERYNIRTDKRELRKIISGLKADLIGIQEINNAKALKSFFTANFKNMRISLSKSGGQGKQKLGFVYNTNKLELIKGFEDKTVNETGCARRSRPAYIATFLEKSRNLKFTAINLHLKAGGRQKAANCRGKQYNLVTKLVKKLKKDGHKNIVVLGDLNTTFYVHKAGRNYKRFKRFVNKNKFRDYTSRLKCTTYYSKRRGKKIKERHATLDHIMLGREFYKHPEVKGTNISVKSHCRRRSCKDSSKSQLGLSYKSVSDHCPVLLEMKFK